MYHQLSNSRLTGKILIIILKKGRYFTFNNTLITFCYGHIGVGHMLNNYTLIHEFRCHHHGYSSIDINIVCILPYIGPWLPRHLLHQLWSTGWNGTYDRSADRSADSVRYCDRNSSSHYFRQPISTPLTTLNYMHGGVDRACEPTIVKKTRFESHS